jgi:alkylation response protein AidB-like acyl-CoA dehydrogenase
MDFSLSAEQRLLRDSLAAFLADHHDLHAAAEPGGGLWRALAVELGVLGATLPEEAGGSGGGPVEAMVIAEQLGQALVAEPYVDTVVLGGGVLRRAPGTGDVLAGIAAGDVRIAPALSGGAPDDVTTTARRDGSDRVLTGTAAVVPGAPSATHLLLAARTPDEREGTSLFLVPVEPVPAGMRLHPLRTIDGRAAADVELDGVRVPAGALVGEPGDAAALLAPALDEATAAVVAEAVGILRAVLTDTVAYCTQRQQFGQPIGSFQVLQHRMVDMHLELEQSISAMYLATLRLGAEPPVRARAVSAAKVTVSRAARFVGQSAVQLHGGMGMTQELAIGHRFTRLTAIEHELGSADHHRARYADLAR